MITLIYESGGYDFDEVRSCMAANYPDEYPDENAIPDSAVWDEMRRWEEVDWEDISCELCKFLKGNSWLVFGTVGAWDGPKKAGAVITNLGELSVAWSNCDYVKIWDEDGRLFVRGDHHDGVNLFEVRRIAAAGMKFLEEHEYDEIPLSKMHETVFCGDEYSALPYFWRWINNG